MALKLITKAKRYYGFGRYNVLSRMVKTGPEIVFVGPPRVAHRYRKALLSQSVAHVRRRIGTAAGGSIAGIYGWKRYKKKAKRRQRLAKKKR